STPGRWDGTVGDPTVVAGLRTGVREAAGDVISRDGVQGGGGGGQVGDGGEHRLVRGGGGGVAAVGDAQAGVGLREGGVGVVDVAEERALLVGGRVALPLLGAGDGVVGGKVQPHRPVGGRAGELPDLLQPGDRLAGCGPVFVQQSGEAVGVEGVQAAVFDDGGPGGERAGDVGGVGVGADRGGEVGVGEDAVVAGGQG